MGDLPPRVEAIVQMDTDYSLTGRRLAPGTGVNIYCDGVYFPGRVLECTKILRPGDTGKIIIGILDTCDEPFDRSEGAEFELRDGPSTRIGLAKIIREMKDSN